MGVTDMTQDRRTVGAVALIPTIHNTSVISADLIKITPKLNNVFMYCMFKYGGVSKYISQFANGANVLHLRPQVVGRLKVFLPTEDIIENSRSHEWHQACFFGSDLLCHCKHLRCRYRKRKRCVLDQSYDLVGHCGKHSFKHLRHHNPNKGLGR